MFPSVPDYPAYTYLALGVLWLFALGALVVLLIGMVRGLLYVLSGAGRVLTAVLQWLCGLPLVSAGSAHFATRREVQAAGLLGDTGLPLAAYGQGDTLREPAGGHIVIFGPPRSWKSSGVIMPALRQFPGSIVCNDLRGELYDRTHEQREAYGPTFRFAPTSAESCRINILDLVRWGSQYQHGDVARIVHHLLSPPERQTPPSPFVGGALPVLTSIVIHGHDLDAQHASFPAVVSWMVANRSLKEKIAELLSSPNPLVRSGARRLADQSERLRSATWNACLEPLAVFEDPAIAANTSHSDVAFSELLEGLEPVSLFLCPSFSAVRRLSGLLGAFVESLVAVLGSPERQPRHQVLLVLDEMANLGYLPELERAVSYLQGSGTQLLATFQNIPQVTSTYGESPLLASFATQLHYRPNDQATAEHIGGMLGTATVLKTSVSSETGLLGRWAKGQSVTEQERPLLTTDELLRLPPTAALVLQAGCAPILTRKLGVPAPPTKAQVRTFAAQHARGCAAAAGVLLVLGALIPALQPAWQAPPTVLASLEHHPALASMLPPPAPTAPASVPATTATGETPPPPSVPAALAPMDTGPAGSAQGPPEPRAVPPGMVLSRAPLAGTSRWELRIKMGDRTPPELHTHAQTESACRAALEALGKERGAQRDGETFTWTRKLFGEALRLQAWCQEAKG